MAQTETDGRHKQDGSRDSPIFLRRGKRYHSDDDRIFGGKLALVTCGRFFVALYNSCYQRVSPRQSRSAAIREADKRVVQCTAWGRMTNAAMDLSCVPLALVVTMRWVGADGASRLVGGTFMKQKSRRGNAGYIEALESRRLLSGGVTHLIHAHEQIPFTGIIGKIRGSLPGGNSVTIDWGDGNITDNVTSHRGKRTIVSASHLYESAGRYAVTVTQPSVANGVVLTGPILIKATAIVRPTAFSAKTIRAKAVPIHPVAGEEIHTVPGELVNVPSSLKSVSAQIDWGDGSNIDTVTASFSGGTIIASDGHTYQKPGDFTAVVTFKDGDHVLGRATETVTVSNISAGGMELAATTGTRFQGVVGTISHLYPDIASSGPAAPPDEVGIEWGDGTRSLGTFVDLGKDRYQVTGAHTYEKPGTYRINVVGGNGLETPWPIPGAIRPLAAAGSASAVWVGSLFTVANSSMKVTGNAVTVSPPTVLAKGLAVSDAYEDLLSGPIAELDGFPNDPYHAPIYAVVNWGDGNTGPNGDVTVDQNGNYILDAFHPYASSGLVLGTPVDGVFTLSITFMLNDHVNTDDNTVLATTTTTVNVLPYSKTAVILNLTHDVSFSGSLGTFTVEQGSSVTSATIFWDDSSTSTSDAIVTPLGNNTYEVKGVHLFSNPGQYRVAVQAQVKQPDTQTTSGGNEFRTVLFTIATVS
jgi:hypothetical protein